MTKKTIKNLSSSMTADSGWHKCGGVCGTQYNRMLYNDGRLLSIHAHKNNLGSGWRLGYFFKSGKLCSYDDSRIIKKRFKTLQELKEAAEGIFPLVLSSYETANMYSQNMQARFEYVLAELHRFCEPYNNKA